MRRENGERWPQPRPLGSARAPRSRLLRGATSPGDLVVELGSVRWPLWGSRGRLSCAGFTTPPPLLPSLRPGRAQNPLPTATLRSVLPRTMPRPALEVPHPEEDRGRRGCGGRRRARGCAAAASGSLITSARSAPAPSSQLPSNPREFNSSINRREALHFGERWRGWGSLRGGPHDSPGEQAGTP